MLRRAIVWLVVVATVAVASLAVRQAEDAGETWVVFSAQQRGCAIVIPADAIQEERRAAEMLRAALVSASGRTERAFPIVDERMAVPRRAIFVGATQRRGSFLTEKVRLPFDSGVGLRVQAGRAVLCGERRASIESAVGWWLEKYLGAAWFMPGPLGEHVPRRDALTLPIGEEMARPGFLSRSLALGGGEENRAWAARNRLDLRFEQKHALADIFSPEDFRRTPEMAPLRDGQRYLPLAGDQNWQPDLLSPAAVTHTVAAAQRAFAADPGRAAFAISINDSVRYDNSPATLAAVGPPRFFRHRPDYSDLVFGFANAVAAQLPDRFLSAYAYYWAENTPRFPVARNVVPFLTADRTQWTHAAFAAEDRALIERWCRSGAEVVGVYDYLHGAPFLTPRPMLRAVAETIPFYYGAGVRAFQPEAEPRWALDGPKLWLAAQLLWKPESDPAELLARYYRDFWAEAAEPMREFFSLAEEAWRTQPGPPLWLRFFQDEDEATVHSPAVQRALRAQLGRAAELARTDLVRRRVAFVGEGFAECEAFWAFSAARTRVSRLARDGADPVALREAWGYYRKARATFTARVRGDLAWALRHEPDSRVALALRDAPGGPPAMDDASAEEVSAVLRRGGECLADPAWRAVTLRPIGGSADFDWTPPGSAWRALGEPWEGRSVSWADDPGEARRLRFAGCRTESIGQWVPATEGTLYAAQAKVGAKTRPGTATFLIVSFLDAQHRHLGLVRTDRLPADAAVQETDLCVIARAPAGARFVGFAVRVLNQIEGDFAEFSEASLRRWPE